MFLRRATAILLLGCAVAASALPDAAGLASALNNRANLALDQGDCERATGLYEEALALYRAAQDTRGVAMDPKVDLRVLATRTPGFTGADLANVVNEAALLAARREKNSVGMEELEEAIDRVVAGLERKSRVISEREREIVAVHEMGHALVALTVPTADPVHRVSIIPRGAAALGMTMQRPLEDRYLLQEPELLDRLVILVGGRSAEEIIFKQISTGAQDDLMKATDIARAMVTEYGMSSKLGAVKYGTNDNEPFLGRTMGHQRDYSDAVAAEIDTEVRSLIELAG